MLKANRVYDEELLIADVRAGSERSYRLLYEQWVGRLYAFVYHYVKSEDITDDIVQETFLKIWTNRQSLHPEHSFKAYLFTIAYRMLVKELRRQLNHPLMADYLSLHAEPSTREDEAELEMDFHLFVERLQGAKCKLTPQQWEIFELYKEQEVSVKEIAARLHIEEQVVRNQLSAALKTLRAELSRHLSLFLLFCLDI